MNQFHVGALVVVLTAVFVGCSSTPVSPPPVETAKQNPPPETPASSGASTSVASSSVATVTLVPHLDPSNPISKERSVYFDYDDFSVKREYAGLIERQGKYMASTPSLSARIEGNADERGSAEYNLALGQKRAEAVLKALKIYGVKDTQMEAISWGRERPMATGHDEASWAQNRRVDLVYPRQ